MATNNRTTAQEKRNLRREAAEFFDSPEKTREWLTTQYRQLNFKTPAEMMNTKEGMKKVKNLLLKEKLIKDANDVFESKEETSKWLTARYQPLGFRSPMEVIDTEEGLKKVRGLLRRKWLMNEATKVFGDVNTAAKWALTSNSDLGGKMPEEIVESEGGAEAVYELLENLAGEATP